MTSTSFFSDEFPDDGVRLAAPQAPEPPTVRRRVGRSGFVTERFGESANPWAGLLLPLPGLAFTLQLGLLVAGLPPSWRAGEASLHLALWLLWVPFLLASALQGTRRLLAETRWRRTRGGLHLDWSARHWHYNLTFLLAFLPVVLLQFLPGVLDAYMLGLMQLLAFFGRTGHVGYDPSPTNLWLVALWLPIWWQASRHITRIPPGRLLGLQRELARLRGEVTWGAEAWGMTVGDVVDHWLAELIPGAAEAPAAGASRRRARQLWATLRRELIASWVQTPPDLARANRAIDHFRTQRSGG
ncbi:MAG: hypothetical protein VKP62_15115 [Candidatus Sericytochromatia bacterium]|nr:hypothetical protein [Candidatus Sericytochromatia bacterium]